jgi:hypothetical protein
VRTKICCIAVALLAACQDDAAPPVEMPDAAGVDAGAPGDASNDGARDASTEDADAEQDAGCLPSGSPCLSIEDNLRCCSRSCSGLGTANGACL